MNKFLFFPIMFFISLSCFADQWDWMKHRSTVDLVPEKLVHFHAPLELELDKAGNVFIVDVRSVHITKLNPKMKMEYYLGRRGQGPGEYITPYDIAIDNERQRIWVSDQIGRKILCYNFDGRLILQKSTPEHQPYSITVLSDGRLVVGGTGSTNMVFYNDKLEIVKKFGRKMVRPMEEGTKLHHLLSRYMCLTTDQKDNIYVGYDSEPVVECYNSVGELKWKVTRPWLLERKPNPAKIVNGMSLNSGERDRYHNNIFYLAGKLYVHTSSAEKEILAFDAKTGKYLGHKKMDFSVRGVAVRNGEVFALDAGDAKIYVYSQLPNSYPTEVTPLDGFSRKVDISTDVQKKLAKSDEKGCCTSPKKGCTCGTGKGKCQAGCCGS